MIRSQRAVLHGVVMALVALGVFMPRNAYAHHVSKDEVIALATQRAEAWGASPSRVLSIIRCETGGLYTPDRPNGQLLIGSHGELGVAQWLRGGAWTATPQYRIWGIDVRAMYQTGDPEALFWDVDGLAWAFSWQAPSGMAGQWSCKA